MANIQISGYRDKYIVEVVIEKDTLTEIEILKEAAKILQREVMRTEGREW